MANSSTQTIQVSSSSCSSHKNGEKEPLPVISRDVALIKLEQKFKDAMNQIADLSAEKEQLEHVNVQLQEETETVGKKVDLVWEIGLSWKSRVNLDPYQNNVLELHPFGTGRWFHSGNPWVLSQCQIGLEWLKNLPLFPALHNKNELVG